MDIDRSSVVLGVLLFAFAGCGTAQPAADAGDESATDAATTDTSPADGQTGCIPAGDPCGASPFDCCSHSEGATPAGCFCG